MTRGRLRGRRGSALILVLLMTLAVAGLAIAAIFLSSSAGLLSRFYDRERDFRLVADAAIELVRARLERDSTLVVPDTGMLQVLSGARIDDADGEPLGRARVNAYVAATGDTSGGGLPTVTIIASSYDASGTRQVRRVDLRRESFSRYQILIDSLPSTVNFGPGIIEGRVHSNSVWRAGTSGAAPTHRDTVTAVAGFQGGGFYESDSLSGVPRIRYPRDSTYPALAARAAAANLSFTPVAETGWGYRTGSRLEFVTVDVDADAALEVSESFVRVFDLASGQDTSRIKVGLEHNTNYSGVMARAWYDSELQNQCGAFYLRDGRWSFFPVATHRANWARAIIEGTDAGDYPAVSSSNMSLMNDWEWYAPALVLLQPTARCFPAGSPYLMTTERMTNAAGVVTGTAADTVPFGVVTPAGGWPASAPLGYGGSDTTFTPRSRTCRISTGGTSGRCNSGTISTLGTWRAFGGTPLTSVTGGVRQAVELPYLWPIDASRNAASRGIVHVSAGPIFVSGEVRGAVTLLVAGRVLLIDALTAPEQANQGLHDCADRLGIVATGDILVADNGLTRGRRIGFGSSSFMTRHFGGRREARIDANLMSLGGTVGVENPSVSGVSPQACPHDGSAVTSGGCFNLHGGAAMRVMTPLFGGSNSGFLYAGTPGDCLNRATRPPFFPLTNRYTFVRSLEIAPSLANSPSKIRTLLRQLKGKPL